MLTKKVCSVISNFSAAECSTINTVKKRGLPHIRVVRVPETLMNRGWFAVLSFLIFFCFLSTAAWQTRVLPSGMMQAAVLPAVLVDQTNEERVRVGETGLRVSPLLTEAAQAKADDMATKGYFAHTSPTGVSPWYWFDQVNYQYAYAGENLAVNFSDSRRVTDAWMNSLLHRQNILNTNFTEIGIATATGVYKGREAVFVVQLFGTTMQEYLTGSVPATGPVTALMDSKVSGQLAAVGNGIDGSTEMSTQRRYSAWWQQLATRPALGLQLTLLVIISALGLYSFFRLQAAPRGRKIQGREYVAALLVLIAVAWIVYGMLYGTDVVVV